MNLKIEDIRNEVDKGRFALDFCAIELLLCQDQIISGILVEGKRALLNNILSKNNDKNIYYEYFGFWGKITSTFVAERFAQSLGKIQPNKGGKIMSELEELQALKRQYFIDRMLLVDEKIVDDILFEINEFIKIK